MKKSILSLIIISVIVLIIVLLFFRRKDNLGNIDVTQTDFVYKVDVCDRYFRLVECIIDKDSDVRFTRQMRIDLKNEVKLMQEKWKDFTEDELNNKCFEELAKFDNDDMKNKLKSFWCSL